MATENVWLGLNDLDAYDTFVWSDAPTEQPGFLKWSGAEPDRADEHCVFQKSHDMSWGDGKCHWDTQSVCETRLPCTTSN